MALGRRFELLIYEVTTGFRLVVIDWTDESQTGGDFETLESAKRHASDLMDGAVLDWQSGETHTMDD